MTGDGLMTSSTHVSLSSSSLILTLTFLETYTTYLSLTGGIERNRGRGRKSKNMGMMMERMMERKMMGMQTFPKGRAHQGRLRSAPA